LASLGFHSEVIMSKIRSLDGDPKKSMGQEVHVNRQKYSELQTIYLLPFFSFKI
jgi:hypothetical protein